jgi:hypothetical protein
MYDEVPRMVAVAVNHADAATEYVELEARGKTAECVKSLVAALVRPLGKRSYVMAGGWRTTMGDGRCRLKLVAFSGETSLGYDVPDCGILRTDG